jgi:hypothetical protein
LTARPIPNTSPESEKGRGGGGGDEQMKGKMMDKSVWHLEETVGEARSIRNERIQETLTLHPILM